MHTGMYGDQRGCLAFVFFGRHALLASGIAAMNGGNDVASKVLLVATVHTAVHRANCAR